MKKYKINLNGKSYEVEVEELEIGAPAPSKNVEERVTDKVESNIPKSSGNVEEITAPMPGNIVEVKVNVGDKVKAGDTLVVLEAMKLENEIVAPRDGVVVDVSTSKGATVVLGDKLVSLK